MCPESEGIHVCVDEPSNRLQHLFVRGLHHIDPVSLRNHKISGEVGIRTEGAAGAALAAVPQLGDVDGPVVLIVTGRNVDDALLRRARDDPESFPP